MYRDNLCGSNEFKSVCPAGPVADINNKDGMSGWFTSDRDQAWKTRIDAKPFLVGANMLVTASTAFAINVEAEFRDIAGAQSPRKLCDAFLL